MYRAKVVDKETHTFLCVVTLYLSLNEFRDNEIKGNTSSMPAVGPT
jgi:hypothetical protein